MHKIVHYVFSTYKRKQVLVDEIAQRLSDIFREICDEKGFEIISLSTLVDHVHILIKKNASDSNEYIMKMIKGISSREIFKLYPSNRFEFRKLWGRGYRAIEIKDDNQLKQTIKYIDNQKVEGLDKRMAGNREVYSPACRTGRQVSAANLRSRKPRRSVSGFRVVRGAGSREVYSQASEVAI